MANHQVLVQFFHKADKNYAETSYYGPYDSVYCLGNRVCGVNGRTTTIIATETNGNWVITEPKDQDDLLATRYQFNGWKTFVDG